MWSQEELNEAIELAKEGKTYDEIGKLLHKTGQSIRCKLLKNKITITEFKELKKYKIVKCLNCGEDVRGGDRKFCNNSCAAIYNNKKRNSSTNQKIGTLLKIPKLKETKHCLYCGNVLKGKNTKFCNNECSGNNRWADSVKKWKDGQSIGCCVNGSISNYLRSYLFKKYDNKCAKCGWSEINEYTGKIPLEVEHIDGNSENNKEENLILLCPNCHSLTKTYKGANRGNGRHNRMVRYRNGQSF